MPSDNHIIACDSDNLHAIEVVAAAALELFTHENINSQIGQQYILHFGEWIEYKPSVLDPSYPYVKALIYQQRSRYYARQKDLVEQTSNGNVISFRISLESHLLMVWTVLWSSIQVGMDGASSVDRLLFEKQPCILGMVHPKQPCILGMVHPKQPCILGIVYPKQPCILGMIHPKNLVFWALARYSLLKRNWFYCIDTKVFILVRLA